MTPRVSDSQSPLEQVHAFWNTEPPDSNVVPHYTDEKDFYAKYREYRYRTEWHIPLLVPFAEAKGKKVLEIGTGNGGDGAMFAMQGADYTGVDLTEAALEATRKHFRVLGLPGRFQKENAERLSFAEGTFDIVFSHGVLHHTPGVQAAIREVHRVLKPGGQAIIMLYHKHSFNYYVRIMIYMRLRLLLKVFSRFGRWKTDRRKWRVSGRDQSSRLWDLHYANFLRRGWSYLRATNFVHHCADGPECPYAYAFSEAEARKLFADFHDVRCQIAHFPLCKYWGGKWLPFAVEKFLASRVGWYLFIIANRGRVPR